MQKNNLRPCPFSGEHAHFGCALLRKALALRTVSLLIDVLVSS